LKLTAYCSKRQTHATIFGCVPFPFLQTTALKNGSLRHDIHYWIGKDTSQVNFSPLGYTLLQKDVKSNSVRHRMKLELQQF
jgi:hypothetical protein